MLGLFLIRDFRNPKKNIPVMLFRADSPNAWGGGVPSSIQPRSLLAFGSGDAVLGITWVTTGADMAARRPKELQTAMPVVRSVDGNNSPGFVLRFSVEVRVFLLL